MPSVAEPVPIGDPDDAYANAAHVAASAAIVSRWPMRARAFRERLGAEGRARLDARYGEAPRERLDWFLPGATAGPAASPSGRGAGANEARASVPRGIALFVHGGYWMKFSPADFSHLAAGAVDRGWLAVLPGYPLCPDATIADIVDSLRRALIAAAELADGPIRLAGHSAGGHLVTRLICDDIDLPAAVAARIDRTLSISGVHDLVPLLPTAMNETFGLTLRDAFRDSPARRLPRDGARVCAWVGGGERPEFVRQSALLGAIWNGVGGHVATHVEPGRHHFDVIEDLTRGNSEMLEWWLGE